MIIVVEGISAAGKTSWIRRFCAPNAVDETGARTDAPNRLQDPLGAAEFWIERNCERWNNAVSLSKATGLAVCDTDPLRLHYVWSLWQIGAASEQAWLAERDASKRAIKAGALGFADAYLIKEITPDQAHVQRDGDQSRARRSFDLHVQLGPPLRRWYEAIAEVLPGAVTWNLPVDGPKTTISSDHRDRADREIFDALIDKLSAASNVAHNMR